MAYHLEGRLLEVCNCRVLCPCWIGEDPDFGTCDTIVSWHFDKGTINGVDVAGHTIAMIAHIPGNILQGNWRAAVYLDDKVSAQAGGSDPRRLHRQAGRPGRASWPSWSAKWCRSKKCRSSGMSMAARGWSRSATPAMPSSSRTRARAAPRRRLRTRSSRRFPARRCSWEKARAIRSKVDKLGINLEHERPQRAAKHVRLQRLKAAGGQRELDRRVRPPGNGRGDCGPRSRSADAARRAWWPRCRPSPGSRWRHGA